MIKGSLKAQEIGHARLFVEKYRETIYLQSMESEGYYFNDKLSIWEKKENNNFIVDVIDFLEKAILDSRNEELITKVLKKVRTRVYGKAVWDLAKRSFIDKEFHKKMNTQPNQLPLKDGNLINLKTLEVRQRVKDDLFDFELPFEFDKAKISQAKRFFGEIMNNDKEITKYLQTILGYCITGETDLRSLYIFWGAGANGKSSLCELLRAVMKKFYVTASKKTFIYQETGSSHTSHLMPLMNARLAVLSETKEGDKLNEDTIKTLTGNDEISARELYGKQFSFKPLAKYIMLTNHKPIFNINDQALLDRIKYIPFNARFTVEPQEGELQKDTEFINDLMTIHLNEVFNWLCIGANRYYKSKGKLQIPKSLQQATDEYINELDSTSQFIDSNCSKGDNLKAHRNKLYEMYEKYCQENGIQRITNSEFYKRLEHLGYKLVKVQGNRYVKGLEVKPNYIE